MHVLTSSLYTVWSSLLSYLMSKCVLSLPSTDPGQQIEINKEEEALWLGMWQVKRILFPLLSFRRKRKRFTNLWEKMPNWKKLIKKLRMNENLLYHVRVSYILFFTFKNENEDLLQLNQNPGTNNLTQTWPDSNYFMAKKINLLNS